MQTIRNALFSVGAAIATRKLLQTFANLDADGMLRPIGLSPRRRHWPEHLASLGAGIVLGGVAGLLLAPESGERTRARAAKKAKKLGESAAEHLRQAGRELLDEVNAVRSPPGNGDGGRAHGSAQKSKSPRKRRNTRAD